MQPRLMRSRTEVIVAGVCGGLGEYFGLDPVIVRLIFVLVSLTTGLGFIVYPILWLVMPKAPVTMQRPQQHAYTQQNQQWHQQINEFGQEVAQFGQEMAEAGQQFGRQMREAFGKIHGVPQKPLLRRHQKLTTSIR
jgi:phage shock protein C